MNTASTLPARVRAMMPALVADLKELTAIPSVSGPGAAAEPLFAAHDLVAGMLRDVGAEVSDLRIEGKTAPVVVARIPAPEGAPTVLLYTHYDVVPAGDESLWDSPPFEPVERDGALYGRGTADSKANVVGIVGALRAWDGRPPVGVVVVVEGQEEVGSPFDTYPPEAPDLFRADAMVIADVGSVRPGTPTLTVALRGSAQVDVEIRTLAGDKHSGQYGGAAPDARLAMIHLLASLHEPSGDVAVPGLRREEWSGTTYTDAEFRELAEIADDVPLLGTGGLGSRIWSGPAITVVGLDAPPSAAPINAVAAHARASLNVRVHPAQAAAEAQAAVVAHLQAQRPFGIAATVTAGEVGNGFAAGREGPAFDAAMAALGRAWDAEPQLMAGGGSIPLVMALHEAVPEAEKLLLGATDSYANIHAPNERVLLDELERAVLTKALFFDLYAASWPRRGDQR
ncbi:M20/M25/M40 family metallo-hydrolase [Georgenia subflava]|uniref:M20/M25/M40 family metallo-hydrolase n=1 Tax=Georgenia subflava TaxID=1622177 RepID=A0A6N7ETC3_9MICO|nr:M20/M25/M40 family metallo-hydrolase [Georgenia subflava]MPV38424.1 M20/M25/M40 family metallo-hydrolase [Georgenia subflava]